MTFKKKQYEKLYRSRNKERLARVHREWREKNKERIKRVQLQWYIKNKLSTRILLTDEQKKEKKKIYWQIWYAKNKEKSISDNKQWVKNNKERWKKTRRKYEKSHKAQNLNYKLSANLRCRLNIAIRSSQKAGSAIRDLGCTIPYFKKYLEKQFKKEMSWNNWGVKGWHIDHIKPLIKFDLTNRKQFLKACHYTNLQPLWAKDNISKGSK